MMKKFIFTLALTLSYTLNLLAQNSNGVEMADALRSSGKIYVVVSVISVVFIGIAIYLFSIDSRLKKIEKQNAK
jgi:CcmD family protein